MWNFLKNLLITKAGMRSVVGVGRWIGFGRLALLAGLIGGVRYWWHRRSTRYA